MTVLRTSAAMLALALGLGGCVQSQEHLSSDFGRATYENLMAQVADPDAQYLGLPAPGSNGRRVGLAQQRYVSGKVIKPSAAATFAVGSAPGDGGSSGGDPSPAPAPGPTLQ